MPNRAGQDRSDPPSLSCVIVIHVMHHIHTMSNTSHATRPTLFVTGAAAGIGRAVAEHFLDRKSVV